MNERGWDRDDGSDERVGMIGRKGREEKIDEEREQKRGEEKRTEGDRLGGREEN